ncbi:MAG: ATP-binding cassette domain-containing protein [Tissierellia bacterium]|nr:ATP-binding cassette domain-containing protein [Tissierellia bacterium]
MTEQNKEVLLDVKHLEITFFNQGKKFRAVKDVNFQIFKGETFALVGESGSGKTTIGRAIIGLNETSDGEIIYKGKKINGKLEKAERRQLVREMQMIFQDPAASLNERATIDYCIAEGLDNFNLYKDREERNQKVDYALRSVGLLPEHKSRYPHEFSGGQRQRVGIARAMIMEPDFIVADEPISALDVSIRAQVLNLMNKFKEEKGLTYLFIAHDLSVVRYFSDRIAVIHKGRIVEIAPTEELFAYPLHPYTRSLLQSVPMPDPRIEKAKSLVVYDESKRDFSGEKPKLRPIRPGHFVFANDREMGEYEVMLKQMQEERRNMEAKVREMVQKTSK